MFLGEVCIMMFYRERERQFNIHYKIYDYNMFKV